MIRIISSPTLGSCARRVTARTFRLYRSVLSIARWRRWRSRNRRHQILRRPSRNRLFRFSIRCIRR